MPRERWPRRLIAGAVGVGLAALLAGCLAVPGAIDGPIAVDMHVSTTPTSVDVDAPGWFADVSAVYLCPSLPPPLPEAAADRIGWTPGGACHDYGDHPSKDGLTLSLPLADLDDPERTAFEASTEWYLLLLDMDGQRVSSAVRTAFGPPNLSPRAT
jgi:hypothetical protein